MLVFIAIAFIFLKIAGIINISWTLVIIGELVLLIASFAELKFIHKKINQRFK